MTPRTHEDEIRSQISARRGRPGPKGSRHVTDTLRSQAQQLWLDGWEHAHIAAALQISEKTARTYTLPVRHLRDPDMDPLTDEDLE